MKSREGMFTMLGDDVILEFMQNCWIKCNDLSFVNYSRLRRGGQEITRFHCI